MLHVTDPTAILGLLFGGVLSLLYGVRLITDAMEQDAGARLRKSLLLFARHPLAAFGVGVGVTMLTQSSGATSSLLVGLVSADLLPLPIAIVTLLGTAVGSALVVQLLMFHITDYAFVFLGIGAAAALLTRHSARRGIGQALFGFGLIILGLAALEASSLPLATSHTTALLFAALLQSPLILVLLGMALAMIFSSSIAGIGLIIALASRGAVPLSAALALLLGSNVGTTATALLSALTRGSVVGRRLAFVHTGMKLALALLVLCLLGPLSMILAWTRLPTTTLVALSHLGFNLLLALLFMPLAGVLTRLMEHLVPDQVSQERTRPLYLHSEALATPAVALGQAMREILHMTDLVSEMLVLGIHAFEEKGVDIPARISALDDQLDELNIAIKHYLTQLKEEQMDEQQKERQVTLLYIIADLEAMGDIIDRQWMRLARRKRRKQIVFSPEGWQDLVDYHRELCNTVQQMFAALAMQDPGLTATFFSSKAELSRMRRMLHFQHIQRLRSGVVPSIESSALHLDLLNAFRAVLSQASAIARSVQEERVVEDDVERAHIAQ